MRVYRENLLAAFQEGDRFEIECWPEKGTVVQMGSRLQKAIAKKVSYQLRVANSSPSQVVHFLDHSSGYLIPRVPRDRKIVATLHDLIPLRFPGGLSENQVERFRKTVSYLKECDAVVSVSEYSKREAIELIGLREEQIHVVPNGVTAPRELKARCQEIGRLREAGAQVVVLSIGSLQERKNLRILPGALKAFQQETGLKAGLLRVGPLLDASLSAEIQKVCEPGCFLEAGRLSESSLWQAYQSCDMVIVPSFYEGFGLPVIEALACGKGVAASSQSSLPEVGGEWAEYFNPDSEEEAGRALARLVPAINVTSIEVSRKEAVQGLTWRKHLEGLYQVYESVLAG